MKIMAGLFLAACRKMSRTRRAPTPTKTFSGRRPGTRSEEHTSELQSRFDLVCRLLLEKKKKKEKNALTIVEKYKIIYHKHIAWVIYVILQIPLDFTSNTMSFSQHIQYRST